jgi:hypothetical protein
MLGSFLNVQNDKIFIVAVFAGALIFIGFLKSFPSIDIRRGRNSKITNE